VASWNPPTLEAVSRAFVMEKFFNTAVEDPVPAPAPALGDGGGVPRDSAVWMKYEAQRKPDQLDLSLAGGGGAGRGGRDGGKRERELEQEKRTNYGLATEEEIRAVLVRAKGTAGMTRRQLEMGLKGNRPVMKFGLKERLNEVIGRKGLAVEGGDRLVWREREGEE
jgi:hypothetical protein